jgi:protease I
VDVNLKNAKAEEYDALMIPGGVINPDAMRRHKEYIDLQRNLCEVASLWRHLPWSSIADRKRSA